MLTEYDRRAIEATIDLYPMEVTNGCIVEYIKENMEEIAGAYTSNAVANKIAGTSCERMQVLEKTEAILALKNNAKRVSIITNVFRPKIIKTNISMVMYSFIRNLSRKINDEITGKHDEIILRVDDGSLVEALYCYIEKKYKSIINDDELVFNKNDISIEFTDVHVSFEFNYLVNLDNVKKVEYIMYSLLQNLDL